MEPRSEDFFTHRCSIHIEAPPEVVWEIAGDLGQAPQWAASGQVLAIEKLTEGPVGTGTVYRAHEKIGMKFDSESTVVAYEPDRLLIWHTRPIGLPFPEGRAHRWAFRLEPEQDGTRLTQDLRAAKAGSYARVMQMLASKGPMKRKMIAGIDGTLDRIKKLAESRVGASSASNSA